MGDILHALPAVTALRAAHPDWRIDWVVEPRWRALLSADGGTGCDTAASEPQQPMVDRLHLAAMKQWSRAPLSAATRNELFALRRALRAEHYDAVVDFQGAVRSAFVGRISGAPRVIGEEQPREPAARWLFNERVATRGAHVIEQDIEIASAIAGDVLTFVRPQLPFDPAAEAWAGELLGGAPSHPVVLINPGAGWGAKRWPLERYGEVARALASHGCRVLVNAGPGEEPLAAAIVEHAHGAASQLAPSLERLIAVLRRVHLLIAGDTGPLHLACALGKPVVGIYGPTDPARNGPFGTNARVLRSSISRRDHSRHEAPEAGLLTIEPAAVLDAARDLLAEEWS